MSDVETRLKLITRNLQEVLGSGEDRLRAILEAGKPLRIYWGTATTGKPHIGYFVPITKIADFLNAGCHVTILFADLHAFLDNMKAPWSLLQLRTQYYESIIKGMLQSIGVPLEKLKFVQGTTFQLSKEYSLDVYKLCSLTTERNSKKAGAEVVRQLTSPFLSSLLYPLLQALDEVYLECDAQFGGLDQRKIFTFAEEYLPKIGYERRVHLMNPMVPSLQGKRVKAEGAELAETLAKEKKEKQLQEGEEENEEVEASSSFEKMSSSDKNSKIDILDPADVVNKKIAAAFCEEGNVEQNGVLEFARLVLFPLSGGKFVIERLAKHGGPITYTDYEVMKQDFADKKLHPGDLKKGVMDGLNALLEPIRKSWAANAKLIQLTKEAYPEEEEPAKVETKEEKKEDTSDKKASKGKSKAAAPTAEDISRLEIRVGKFIEVDNHPEAESLYVSKIDVGEKEPRVIVSGLKNYFSVADLKDSLALILCNIKPTNLKKVKSFGMVLAAAAKESGKVELVRPPAGSKPGELLQFKGYEFPEGEFARVNEKVLEKVLADFKTDSEGAASYKDVPGLVKAGKCTVSSLFNTGIH